MAQVECTLTDSISMDLIASVASVFGRHRARFLRYSGVAAFNVVVGQALLLAFYAGLQMPAVGANLTAAAIGAVPAYLLNRYWVWEKRSRNHFWGEIFPFWAMILIGVGFSSVAVYLADRQWDSVVAVSGASLFAYGVVWVMKYLVLDNFLFTTDAEPALS